MTHEHLVEDIGNVMAMARPPRTPEEAERVRETFHGLLRHLSHEEDVPERVLACVAEGVRVLDGGSLALGEGRWGYARTCLEAALEFAGGADAVGPPVPAPPA